MNRDMALRTVSTQRKISVGAGTSTLFLQEANDRVGIIVNAPLTNRFTLSLATGAVLDEGITLYPGNDPLILTVEQHGQLVTCVFRRSRSPIPTIPITCEPRAIVPFLL